MRARDELAQARGDDCEERLELDLRGERVADLVQRLELAQPARRGLVQARVLDCDGGLRGEQLRELLVVLRELAAVALLRQVQVPVHDAAEQDRHSEEGLSSAGGSEESRPSGGRRRCRARRERLRLSDDDAEKPAPDRLVADRRPRLVVHAGRQEPLEDACPRRVDDAERRVPRAGELRRSLDDPLEKGVERELGAQRDARVDEESQTVLHRPTSVWLRGPRPWSLDGRCHHLARADARSDASGRFRPGGARFTASRQACAHRSGKLTPWSPQ